MLNLKKRSVCIIAYAMSVESELHFALSFKFYYSPRPESRLPLNFFTRHFIFLIMYKNA